MGFVLKNDKELPFFFFEGREVRGFRTALFLLYLLEKHKNTKIAFPELTFHGICVRMRKKILWGEGRGGKGIQNFFFCLIETKKGKKKH